MMKKPVTMKAAEQVLKDIRRMTRKLHSSEEKIRTVPSGLHGEDSIAELCRKEGKAQSLEYMSVEGVAEWFRVIPDIPTNANAKQEVPGVVADTQGQAFAEEITAFWADQAKIVTPMWDSPVEAFGQDQLARAMEKIYTKVSTPAEALAEAQTASQGELERFLAG